LPQEERRRGIGLGFSRMVKSELRACVFAPFVPGPAIDHAGGVYLRNYLRALSGVFDVTLISETTPDNARAIEDLDLHIECSLNLARESRSSQNRAVRSFKYQFGNPLSSSVWRIGEEAEEAIRNADLVDIEWFQLLPLISRVRVIAPTVPVAYTPHDVFSQRSERVIAAAPRSRRWVRRRIQLTRVRRSEAKLCNQVDTIAAFSGKDAELFESIGVRIPVRVVHPPLDQPSDIAPNRAPHEVLFTGFMSRGDNHGAAIWFLDRVWPRVRDAVPEARFVVVGSKPRADLANMMDTSVTVTGWVDDLSVWYQQAAVFVAPLRSGAGLKFKVPQAMLHGLPVVATTIAAEGIVEDSGVDAFAIVTDDPERMARCIIDLLTDEKRARAVGERARKWALDHYSFERTVGDWIDHLEQLAIRFRSGSPRDGLR
jgi:glycosyltransferase involved in cell wall biosynthesis